jgi:uncharacterized RDD family membrane protein YckC
MTFSANPSIRAGPWRRMGAAWTDAFVVYAVVAVLIAIAALAQIRLAYEPVIVVVASAYGVALSLRGRQTIGKTLLGVAARSGTGGVLRLRDALIRETAGKWAIVVLPVLLGRALVGRAWVPTVYDGAILLPVVLLLGVYRVIAKRTWHDRLAGTIVVRAPALRLHRRRAFAQLIAARMAPRYSWPSARTWSEHRDINDVMLATSLLPDGFLVLSRAGRD